MTSIKQVVTRTAGSIVGITAVGMMHATAFAAGASAFNTDNSQIHVGGDNSFSSAPAALDLKTFIANFGSQILDIALLLIAIVAVLYLVFYGYQYITAGGDPEKAKKARSGIINAIIGIIVVALAFTIVHFAINASAPLQGALDTTKSNGSGGF